MGAPSPKRASGAPVSGRAGLRTLLGLLLLIGAAVVVLSDEIMRNWGVGRSLLDSMDVLSGHWFSTFVNREHVLVGIVGCEDHEHAERLLAAWPPDAGVDAACFMSEDALAEDVNATLVADRFDVRVVTVHDAGWLAAWGAALALFVQEGYEHVLLVQSDVLLPAHSVTALREALRNNAGVDVLLPVVATGPPLVAADGLKPPPGGSAAASYPSWIATALGASRPHPLLSYQLLARVHPWLPDVLRSNVSSQAGTVQQALLSVNLPGSKSVPPRVVVLPRWTAPSDVAGGALGAGYTFTAPVALAAGRGLVQRHEALLQAHGLLSSVPHGELHAHGDDADGDSGSGEGAPGGRLLLLASNSSGGDDSDSGAGGVQLRLQQRLSASASFAVATRALVVHAPLRQLLLAAEAAPFGAAASGGGKHRGASSAASKKKRRVIGVPWTGEGLPQGRGDDREILVFFQGQLLRRVRGKGRGRGRAFKARWSTESTEPLPPSWAALTQGMENTPIVVDVELLPPLPAGEAPPVALASSGAKGASAVKAHKKKAGSGAAAGGRLRRDNATAAGHAATTRRSTPAAADGDLVLTAAGAMPAGAAQQPPTEAGNSTSKAHGRKSGDDKRKKGGSPRKGQGDSPDVGREQAVSAPVPAPAQ